MENNDARRIIKNTFEQEFNEGRYSHLIRNMLEFNESTAFNARVGYNIPKAFRDHIKKYHRVGKYIDPNGKVLDVLVVSLKKEEALGRARTMQRNFVAWYLNDNEKEAALAAFHADGSFEWRFSFVRMTYRLNKQAEKLKIKKEVTEARRYSFLVGKGEPSHTAQQHLTPFLLNKDKNPTIESIEQAFSIERVTDRFFDEYKLLFEKLKKELDVIVEKDSTIRKEFEAKEVDTSNFAKKLLGQLVFLYFLQKKGWLGVEKDDKGNPANWGTGRRDFLRKLFDGKDKKKNFFNDILEPLFYSTLAIDRRANQDWCDFDCRIPFLNGGLFEPIKNYDWQKTDIKLKDEIFREIFDIFDQYNFTVKEDEPLEKEVAVDPEMLGKVFEKLLDSVDQKSKGAFYTPREIVHYMCQQSVINYLSKHLTGKVKQEDIEELVYRGDLYNEINQAIQEGRLKPDNRNYQAQKLPADIIKYANEIDKLLEEIKICDPAIGSGAFPVGMMQEVVRVREVLTTHIGHKEVRTPYYFKRQAIEKSLYGVDIDASAIDIAKLRLWLSLVVDEENVHEISPLPNLDYKIMQGDSLLENYKGIELYDENRIRQGSHDIASEIAAWEHRVKTSTEEYIKRCNKGNFSRKLQQEYEKEIAHYQKEIKQLKDMQNTGAITARQGDPLFEGVVSESELKKRKLQELRTKLFNETDKERKDALKEEIEEQIWEFIRLTLKEQNQEEVVDEVEQYRNSNQRPFMLWRLHFDDVFERENGGFDVVIGNPPYVSNKMVDKEFQEYYKQRYGISDDLYNYFFIKAFDICRDGGIVTYISSNTYLTIQTKLNLRRLFQSNRILEIIKTENVFKNAMVSPAIIIMRKEDCNNIDYELIFKDAIDDFEQPQIYPINKDTFKDAVNRVFFVPTPLNIQIYKKYNSDIKQLHDKWWDKISSSKKITDNEEQLENYRKSLQPGDLTLLGLITEGGVGLQTADNGRFVGVLVGSSTATRTYQTRPAKLFDAIKKKNIANLKNIKSISDAREFLSSMNEMEIRTLFDKLKNKYDRDIFGQGYLYKLISIDEIADCERLSEEEKQNGIKNNKPNFVRYEKGDKDGNRWYLETPFYIDWSQESVKWLKTNSGKKGRGMPVVRNSQFYFKEGFCWTDVNSTYLKCRIKGNGVHDVLSMSLFSQLSLTPDWFIVCLINSKLISEFVDNFLNNTSHFQINDARQLPVIIPDSKQLTEFKTLFDRAYEIKKKQFSGQISESLSNQKLDEIQSELDKMVYRLYGIEV